MYTVSNLFSQALCEQGEFNYRKCAAGAHYVGLLKTFLYFYFDPHAKYKIYIDTSTTHKLVVWKAQTSQSMGYFHKPSQIGAATAFYNVHSLAFSPSSFLFGKS